ncbi:MAG: type II secretion system GspH family protein [Bdellovibrionales bacterium]|nr:type II secretion system GspH family protein [Bdellovibrionales bacterium]
MNMKLVRISKSGFSLIELSVGVAILAIAFVGAMSQLNNSQRLMAGRKAQLQTRNILLEVISVIRGSPGLYPALEVKDFGNLTYVRCYNTVGAEVPTRQKQVGAIGVPLTQDDLRKPAKIKVDAGTDFVCGEGFEVHLQPTSNPNEVLAVAMIIPPDAEAGLSQNQWQKLVTMSVYSTTIRFSSSL